MDVVFLVFMDVSFGDTSLSREIPGGGIVVGTQDLVNAPMFLPSVQIIDTCGCSMKTPQSIVITGLMATFGIWVALEILFWQYPALQYECWIRDRCLIVCFQNKF